VNTAAMEAFLARLYTDAALRDSFITAPAEAAHRAGLDEEAVQALVLIDRGGLLLAADSYASKRASRVGADGKRRLARLLRELRELLG